MLLKSITNHVRSFNDKSLREQEWKRMAVYWNFSESQIRAIEHQYTGQFSYREHGYRMLLIWLDGKRLALSVYIYHSPPPFFPSFFFPKQDVRL